MLKTNKVGQMIPTLPGEMADPAFLKKILLRIALRPNAFHSAHYKRQTKSHGKSQIAIALLVYLGMADVHEKKKL